jgi:hypothetical protein
MSNAYSWNVTIPNLPNVGGSLSVRYVINDDLLIGNFGNPGGVDAINPGCTVFALSLKQSSRGTLLWIKNYTAPHGNITRSFESADPVNRVFTMSDKETMQWSGYSLDTGERLWGPVGETRDFNFYPTIGSGGVSQVGFVAYGNLYVDGYGGELFCYDIKTGNLLWKYNNTNSGLETPWGLYPLFTGAIADGKIYVYSNEHSPNVPQYKGERVRCINATTGEEIWTMLGWAGVGGFGDMGFPVADGCLAYLNAYDGQIYCIGKGPSATTVTIQNDVVAEGNSVLIKGSVIDVCAGAKQLVQTGEFNVVPAMSDASMGSWMEYIYMQKPMPTDATGVQVKLTAIDPNGNYQDVGTATSDVNGNFAIAWTPPVEGMYQVTVTFEGSNSYYGSTQTTYFTVSAAPAASPTTAPTTQPTAAPTTQPTVAPTASPSVVPEPEAAPSTDIYVIAAAAAVIIVVAAVAAVILRKRK